MSKIKKCINDVFRIYRRDIKNILSNYVTLIIIIGLIVLPSLYAWFNIEASWNPYGNTKGLLVAVVNLDEGSEFKNIKINVGKDVVKQLKNNQSIGWQFVSSGEADSGVKSGKYYASLTIPKDFSKNFLSVITDDMPKKANLIYNVNEKTNAIAPKITDKGATALQEEITKTFIETASGTILSYLNKFGIGLEKNKPEFKKIIDMMVSIDGKMPELTKSIDNVYDQTLLFQKYIQKVSSETSNISGAVDKTVNMAKSNDKHIGKAGDLIQNISPIIKINLTLIKNTADDTKILLDDIKDVKSYDRSSLKKILSSTNDKYTDSKKRIDCILNLMKSINSRLNSNVIERFISKFLDIRSEISDQQNKITSVINLIDSNNEISDRNMSVIKEKADKISELMDTVIVNYDSETSSTIDTLMKNFTGLSSDTVKILEDFQSSIPLVSDLLKGANTGIDLKVNEVKDIKDKLPAIKQDIHSNVEKLNNLNNDEKLDEVIKILKKDAKKESEFLANPIDLKQNRIYPIPNYGSAMSPFYSTLAIWVGGFILVSLLSVEVKKLDEDEKLSVRVKFWGRYLTFLSIGIAQAVVVLIGNLLLLKTYVISPIPYLLFGIYVSMIFTTIIYTTVSVLGNIGKAIIMVVMVLQVSASGGTFPVQLLGSFFQYINPLLPFTYAIGGLRETVAGIIPQVLINDILALSIYFFVSIFLAMAFKEKINKVTESFMKQFKNSGLAEH